MIDITLDRERIINLAKSRSKKFDGIDYSYDPEFDVLRLQVGDTYGLVGSYAGENVYVILDGNHFVYAEIYGFLNKYSIDEYKAAITNRKVIKSLPEIYKRLSSD